jgi:hypothetical protein
MALIHQGVRLEENVRALAAELRDPVILPCDFPRDAPRRLSGQGAGAAASPRQSHLRKLGRNTRFPRGATSRIEVLGGD